MKEKSRSKSFHLGRIFFPKTSKFKARQKSNLPLPLDERVFQLNQRAEQVRDGLERSISSLQTERLGQLTNLNQKTSDLDKTATAFANLSSKHLKQELNKKRQISFVFQFSIIFCVTLISFLFAYLIVQIVRYRTTI